MTLKPEVLAAMDCVEFNLRDLVLDDDDEVIDAVAIIRAELLAMDARMREAKRLLRECAETIRPALYGNYVHAAMAEQIRLYLQGGAEN